MKKDSPTAEAKVYLLQLRKLNLIIENKLAERQQLRDMALSITARSDGDRVQSSGSHQKMASAVDKLVDLEREIDTAVDAFIDKRKEIIATIESLSPSHYDVLFNLYVQNMSLSAYAELRGKEYTWASTIKGRALQALQTILSENKGT